MRVNRKPFVFLTLMLSFFVPLFFAESWLLGFYLPFQWFNYYLSPPMAILAAVSVVFAAEKFSAYYSKNNSVSSSAPIYKFGRSLRKNLLKILTISLIVLMVFVLVVRSDQLYGKISAASVFYSTTDIKAYDAGVWLNQHYPGDATLVDTPIPGSWFAIFSGKNVIQQTAAQEGQMTLPTRF